jgi:hypothetical protein
MHRLRRIRDAIKRHDKTLYFVTAILAIYLVTANLLKGGKWPHDGAFDPWRWTFVFMLISAIYVPLYALYKAIDAYFESEDKKQQKLDSDLALLCQEAVAALVVACPAVAATDLATSVWLCGSTNLFARRWRFYLPEHRLRSGVKWRKGKGVVGWAWEHGKEIAADLTVLYAEHRKGAQHFNGLASESRYGMSYDDVDRSSTYRGVVAIPLRNEDDIAAVFAIDYSGAANFDCIKGAARSDRHLRSLLGSAEELLTAAVPTRTI